MVLLMRKTEQKGEMCRSRRTTMHVIYVIFLSPSLAVHESSLSCVPCQTLLASTLEHNNPIPSSFLPPPIRIDRLWITAKETEFLPTLPHSPSLSFPGPSVGLGRRRDRMYGRRGGGNVRGTSSTLL